MAINNIFLKPGQIFRVVRDDEPLQEHFLVRQMYEDNTDGEGFDTMFRGEWLGTAWHTAKDELPGWIGKSYNDLNNVLSRRYRKFNYEIIEIIDL